MRLSREILYSPLLTLMTSQISRRSCALSTARELGTSTARTIKRYFAVSASRINTLTRNVSWLTFTKSKRCASCICITPNRTKGSSRIERMELTRHVLWASRSFPQRKISRKQRLLRWKQPPPLRFVQVRSLLQWLQLNSISSAVVKVWLCILK